MQNYNQVYNKFTTIQIPAKEILQVNPMKTGETGENRGILIQGMLSEYYSDRVLLPESTTL